MIKHFFKVRTISVIRILNCSLSFRIVRSKQLHFSSRSSISRPKFLQILHITIIKSHYNIEVAEICLARCGFEIPCFFNTFKPRLSDRSPRWRSSIPALSISQSALFPLFSRRYLRIASAEGERHIFPRQTNRIFRSLLSAILNEKGYS